MVSRQLGVVLKTLLTNRMDLISLLVKMRDRTSKISGHQKSQFRTIKDYRIATVTHEISIKMVICHQPKCETQTLKSQLLWVKPTSRPNSNSSMPISSMSTRSIISTARKSARRVWGDEHGGTKPKLGLKATWSTTKTSNRFIDNPCHHQEISSRWMLAPNRGTLNNSTWWIRDRISELEQASGNTQRAIRAKQCPRSWTIKDPPSSPPVA